MGLERVGWEVVVDDKASSGLHKAKAATDEFGGAMEHAKGIARELGEVLGTAFGIYQIFEFGKESMDFVKRLNTGNAEIQASLVATGQTAKFAKGELDAMAESLDKSSVFDIGDIKKSQSILLTFPKIIKTNFEAAQQAAADMTAKMGGDLPGAVVRIGKALQDPVNGVMQLRREGVNFTKVQQQMLKHLVETGHGAQAQLMILKELHNEFGGSAKAAFDNDPMMKYTKGLDTLRELVGNLLIKAFNAFYPYIMNMVVILQDSVKWIQKHKEVIETLLKVVAAAIVIYKAYQMWVVIDTTVTKLWTASQAIAAGYTAAEAAEVAGLSAAMEILNGIMKMNPFLLIAAGITAVVGGYELFKSHSDISDQVNQTGALADKWKDAGTEHAKYDAQFKDANKINIQIGIDKMNAASELKKYQDYLTYGFYNGGTGKVIRESTLHNKEGMALSMDEWVKQSSTTMNPAAKVKKDKNSSEVPADASGATGPTTTVAAGGSKVNQITINIKTLAEFNIVQQSLEKINDIKEKLTQAALESANDFNIISST